MSPYWIKVEPQNEISLLNLGVGITAQTEAHARRTFEEVFGDSFKIAAVTVVSDVNELDQNHVVPNMGNLLAPGVWFPDIALPFRWQRDDK